jgi:glycosyltransferase involved in cell wall biosynthesis
VALGDRGQGRASRHHAALLQQIESSDLTERVFLLGQLPREQTLGMMRSATAVIHASIFDDPFANSIIEALACGTPLIGSDVGSIREVVVPDESALLFPSGDSEALADRMRQILQQPSLGARLAQSGIQIVESRYTMGKILDLTERALYEAAGCGTEAECASA